MPARHLFASLGMRSQSYLPSDDCTTQGLRCATLVLQGRRSAAASSAPQPQPAAPSPHTYGQQQQQQQQQHGKNEYLAKNGHPGGTVDGAFALPAAAPPPPAAAAAAALGQHGAKPAPAQSALECMSNSRHSTRKRLLSTRNRLLSRPFAAAGLRFARRCTRRLHATALSGRGVLVLASSCPSDAKICTLCLHINEYSPSPTERRL